MNAYEATFGDKLCAVHVVARPTVNGPTVHIATPYIVDEDRLQLRWFANDRGHQIELPGGTQDDALARAARFLEQRVGRQAGPFQPEPDRKSPLVIRSLREEDR